MSKLYNILLSLAMGVFVGYDVTYFYGAGLPLALVMVASSCFDIVSVVSELPTSIVFDHVSPKRMLAVGNVVRAVGLICFAVAPSDFWCVLVGQALAGIGSATESGAASALFINDRLREETSFEKILGELAEATGLSVVAGGLVGALLYPVNPVLIWVVPACIYLLAMLPLAAVPARAARHDGPRRRAGLFKEFKASLTKAVRHPEWWMALCMDVGALSVYYLWQVRLGIGSGGVWNQLLGLVMMNVAKAVAGVLNRRLPVGRMFRSPALPLACNIVLCAAFAWSSGLLSGLALFFAHVTVHSWVLNYYSGRVHAVIDDDERATVFSALSMGNTLVAAVVAPLCGYVADTVSLGAGMSITLVVYLVPLAWSALSSRTHHAA